MATPTLSKHAIAGVLGEILVDVRAAGRGAPRPAVILLHGFKGFKDWGMFPPFAERLARAGFTAVSPNVSGSGVDDAGEFTRLDHFGHNTYSAELEDLRRVLEAVREGGLGIAPPTSVGLVGHSRGGGIAVLHTARDRGIDALVTWSAVSSVARWSPEEMAEWRARGMKDIPNVRTGQKLPLYTDVLEEITRDADGALDILAAASRIEVPWLIIHGREDESVPWLEAKALRAANPRETTRLMLIDQAGHTFGAVHPWRGEGPATNQVFDATLAWLATHLR